MVISIDKDINSKTFGKPDIVLFHNSSKGGVDTVDKNEKTYSVTRTTIRWADENYCLHHVGYSWAK